jgi:DnaJ-class molecular chaperone
MIKFKELKKAKEVLGLPNKASLFEIKNACYELVQEYHPDKQINSNKDDLNGKMKELNKAYEILIEYCNHYKFSFDRKDFRKQFPSPYDEEWIFKHSSF